MKRIKLIFVFLILISTNSYSQYMVNCLPDTGSQSFDYSFRLNGSGSEWSISPYYVIDFWGGGVFADSVRAINDSVILAHIY